MQDKNNRGNWRGREEMYANSLYLPLNFFVTLKLLQKIKSIKFLNRQQLYFY